MPTNEETALPAQESKSSLPLRSPGDPARRETIQKVNATVAGREWRFHFDRFYSELLLDASGGAMSAKFLDAVEPLIHPRVRGLYRYPLTFRTVPLLVQIDPRKGEIGVFSWRGSQELFLEDSLAEEDFEDHVSSLQEASGADAPVDLDLIALRHRFPDFNSSEYQEVYERTLENEKKLIDLVSRYRPSVMERLSDFSLNLTAQYIMVRNHLLKFLAILPSLDHDRRGGEVKRMLLEAIRRLKEENELIKRNPKPGQRPLPRRYIAPITAAEWVVRLVPAAPAAWVIRKTVRFMARRFIAGETIESATGPLKALRATGREATIDQLGELVVSEKEADGYMDKVLELIRGFSAYVPEGERNEAGIYSAHVSIKVTALASQFVPEAFEFTYGLVAPRLRTILLEARKRKVFINIDAEHYQVRDLVFEIYKRVLMETPELRDYDGTGIVVQAYLRDGAEHLEEVIGFARERGVPMPIRLVKGAYWDAETVEAEAHSFKAPEFLNKEETDIYYRQLVKRIFDAHPHVTLCLASHNVFDHAFAEALRAERYPDLPPFEHQCLHMTYEGLSTALASWGVPTRNYVPVGSLLVGMAYLVRRIMENSSQVGFLTRMRSADIEKVLIPTQILEGKKESGEVARDLTREPSAGFENVTPVRLYLTPEREEFFRELSEFRAKKTGRDYQNGFVSDGEWHEVRSPSDSGLLVGRIRFGRREDAGRAVQALAASEGASRWMKLDAGARTAALVRTAQLMAVRRLEIASLVLLEAGKSMSEALADVDEAIDFLNVYARDEKELARRMPDASPVGPTAVIAPWNFPIAIPCGMTAAALAAGNPVVLKSAEQAPLISQVLVDLFHEAGVPRDALIHLPGDGETVGAPLVEDERIEAIVFTGSKAVGTWIARSAGSRQRGGRPVRIITEMGGKNAVVVTSSAELDETVAGTLYSAFAHAGQKCSAMSRVLVDASVKERFIERFTEAISDLQVGESWRPETYVNPVISPMDQERLRRAAQEAVVEARQAGGRVLIDRTGEKLPGNAVAPALIELPPERMKLAESSCRREHFGPIVHLIPYRSLDEAVGLFNSVEYGLTGGVFSQSQDDIDFLLERLQAGNLYVNRSCTGARVAIEPFGGFKLSGTGPKVGQRYYLHAFHRFDRKADPGGMITYGHHERAQEGRYPWKALETLAAQEPEEALALVKDGGEHRVRALWKDYLNWASRNLALWLENGEPNRRIPGQISRDDFRLVRPRALLVTDGEKVDYASWVSLVSALLVGMEAGVRVETEDENAREEWSRRVRHLRELGLKVGMVGPEDEAFIRSSDTFLLDLSEEGFGGWLERVYASPLYASEENPWMPQVLTPRDGPHVRDYPALFRRFVMVRSFAINTMRHGAPLE